jgi:predicted restriction endonuclease
MTIRSLLHAAHIIPKDAPRTTDDERNGIVLCHNHHDAFDAFLFGIEPETKKIVYHPNGPTMNELKIETDRLSPKRNVPHIEAIQWRYKEFQKGIHERYGASPRGEGRSPDERQTQIV